MTENIDFGDFEPEDAIAAGDPELSEIDWDLVCALQGAYDVVLGIEDDEARLDAAKLLVEKLNG